MGLVMALYVATVVILVFPLLLMCVFCLSICVVLRAFDAVLSSCLCMPVWERR